MTDHNRMSSTSHLEILVPTSPMKNPAKGEVARGSSVRSAVLRAITLNSSNSGGSTCSIPLFIAPTFHDADVFPKMLLSLAANDIKIDQFFFSWNGEDERIGIILRDLTEHAPRGTVIFSHHPDNIGFAASVNEGLRLLSASSHSSSMTSSWAFIANADVEFVDHGLELFAKAMCLQLVEKKDKKIGLGYFSQSHIEHYAFAVTKEAVDQAGTMDENFFPAYYEDIDWRWRMNLLGFEDFFPPKGSSPALPRHAKSINLRRGGQHHQKMMQRSGFGAHYFETKWGGPIAIDKKSQLLPMSSAHRTPFGILGFPIHEWVTDETRLMCIREGGPGYPRHGSGGGGEDDGVCWYNGSVLLAILLPHGKETSTIAEGFELPLPLRQPLARGYVTTRSMQ